MGVTRFIRSLFVHSSVTDKNKRKDARKLTKPKRKQTISEFVRDAKMLQN